ncbi:MAG: hypothetical protein Q4A15_10110, partial [Prevotellaceae bacterium]|nr:hypothetical protein [Prevotellaceae bacterium]
MNQDTNAFSMIADYEGDARDLFKIKIPKEVPILPLRNLVLFPGIVSPISIGRRTSYDLINEAYDN